MFLKELCGLLVQANMSYVKTTFQLMEILKVRLLVTSPSGRQISSTNFFANFSIQGLSNFWNLAYIISLSEDNKFE